MPTSWQKLHENGSESIYRNIKLSFYFNLKILIEVSISGKFSCRNAESLAQNFYFRDPSADIGPRKGSSDSDTKSSSSLLRSIFGSEDSESSSTYDSV